MSNENAPSIQQLEREINSDSAVRGTSKQSDSTVDSGVNENVTTQFPGSTVQVGGTKRGENPPIPDEEGGEVNRLTGHQTKAKDFEGEGGPEDKRRMQVLEDPGNDEVRESVRN